MDVPPKRSSLIPRLDALLEKFLRGLSPEERRYLFLVPCVGLFSGLVAVGLEKYLELVQKISWCFWCPDEGAPSGGNGHDAGPGLLEAIQTVAASHPWALVLVPAAGGVVVAVVFLFLKRESRFEGTAGIIESLAFRKGRIPFWTTLASGVASITAVGTGASLGREGAMIHSGAALSSWLGSKLRLADHHVKILLAAGAAGGMAAAYNAPIGATVFAMEILLGSFAIELFGPIIVCSVLSTTVANALLQDTSVYKIGTHATGNALELPLFLLLGGALGLVSMVFIRVFSGINVLFRWLKPIRGFKPVVAMIILGIVGMFFPQLFGNGYDTVNNALLDPGRFPLYLLFLLPVLKILVTSLCRTGGIPGGLFTPSLFVGALLGCAFGTVAATVFPAAFLSDPDRYVLVGMGAIIAGTLQAPITAILLIFELTRDYSIILPLMSACAASTLISYLLQSDSLYTAPLRREGIFLPSASAPSWIRQPAVHSVLTEGVVTVGHTATFKELTEKLLGAPEGHDHLYVTSSEGRCIGVVSLHDIKRFIKETDNLDTVIAADILSESFPCVYATDPIGRAIEILTEFSFERLPVLDSPESRKLLGTVSKRKLLITYNESSFAREGNQHPRDSHA